MFERILQWLLGTTRLQCPDCGGTLIVEYHDMELDKAVYICVSCGKEWI